MYDVIVSIDGRDHVVGSDMAYHEALSSSYDVKTQMKEGCVEAKVRVEEKEGQREGARWLV